MGSKSFEQFFEELINESKHRHIDIQEALAMAHRAGFEYGFEKGKAEERAILQPFQTDHGDEAKPQDTAASRLLRSMPDDFRLP
jgi:hypothetical protein